jgi:hypothetical protein
MRAIEDFGDSCGACVTDARLIDSAGLDTTAFARAGMLYTEDIGDIPDASSRLALAFGGMWIQTLLARRDCVTRLGGFDVDLGFAEDHDFLFRLSLTTTITYVNHTLAVIERTSRAHDPKAPSRLWDAVDFRLCAEQRRLNKWLDMLTLDQSALRTIIRRNLGGLHSSWANWYLEQLRFDDARVAVSRAIRYNATPQLAVKWVLIWAIPALAKHITPSSARLL